MCTGSHPSRHKAVWNVGSGLQLLHSQWGCVEPEEEVKYASWLWNNKCKFLLAFSDFSFLSFFFKWNFIVTFYYRVDAVCPRVAELNPYVLVDMSCSPLDSNTDLSFLRKYQVSRSWVWQWMSNSSLIYLHIYLQKSVKNEKCVHSVCEQVKRWESTLLKTRKLTLYKCFCVNFCCVPSHSVLSWLKPDWAFREKWMSSATHNSHLSKWVNTTALSRCLLRGKSFENCMHLSVLGKINSLLFSMPVHQHRCLRHLCSSLLWLWKGVWGVRPHWRGAQGDFHPNDHSGSQTLFNKRKEKKNWN